MVGTRQPASSNHAAAQLSCRWQPCGGRTSRRRKMARRSMREKLRAGRKMRTAAVSEEEDLGRLRDGDGSCRCKKVHAVVRSFLLLSAGGWRKGVREWEVGNGWRATSLGFSGFGPYMGIGGQRATWALSGLLKVFHQ